MAVLLQVQSGADQQQEATLLTSMMSTGCNLSMPECRRVLLCINALACMSLLRPVTAATCNCRPGYSNLYML